MLIIARAGRVENKLLRTGQFKVITAFHAIKQNFRDLAVAKFLSIIRFFCHKYAERVGQVIQPYLTDSIVN